MRLQARLLWLAAAISIAAAAFPAAVGAAQSSCQPGPGPVGVDPSTAGGVNIHVTANNSAIWCSAAIIEANSDIPNGADYPVRSATVSPETNQVSNAISVAALLSLAGINPASVNHTELARLSGGMSSLDTADLIDPSAQFLDGLKPIFWINGSETQYLRPLRTPSDTNGDDSIVASGGVTLDFYVYSGPVLTVTAQASPRSVATRQPIGFNAQVVDASAADGTLTYTWNFQDGTTATGPSVTHSYAAAGNWYPVVTVQGAGNDSGGVSPPIAVTVGAIPEGAKPGRSGATNASKPLQGGGPKPSAGNTPQTSPTKKHRSRSGNKQSSSNNQTANHSPSHSTTPAQTTTPHTTAPAQTTPPHTAAPAQATTPHTTTPAQTTTSHTTTPTQTTSASAAAAPHRPAATSHHNAAKRRPAPARSRIRPRPSPGATIVRGRLIATVIPVSAAQLAQQSRAAGRPASEAHVPSATLGGGSVAPIAGIAGGCVIMLLLGSGAGLEWRSQRRPVAPPRAG